MIDMAATADNIPGISIDVDDLIAIRTRLSGLSGARIRRQTSNHAGARELHLRGHGMEYAESRAYVYGDDVRTMDWRVMARTGEAHTKVFAEEKDHCCLLAVDLSASMFFGTRVAFKSWAAAQVAAHAGWLANFAGERIGGLVVAPDYHAEIRPEKTRSGLLNVFHHLAQAGDPTIARPDAGNRLGFLLRELNRVTRPGANIALISDFLDIDDSALQALANITRHNQVRVYWIYDDSEVNEWPAGHYPVQRGRRSLLVDLVDEQRRTWLKQRQQQHRERIEALCASFNMLLLPLSCNHDITRQFLQDPEL
jgi:uncharacterized protein (DUF58 family)